MKAYDLYGYDGGSDLRVAKSLIDRLLDLRLEAHESSYHCGEYYRKGNDGSEHFILQYNYDDLEDEWVEEKFSQFPVILYVNETLRPQEVEEKLLVEETLKLLRREEL